MNALDTRRIDKSQSQHLSDPLPAIWGHMAIAGNRAAWAAPFVKGRHVYKATDADATGLSPLLLGRGESASLCLALGLFDNAEPVSYN
jgi:hypothetical protein